MNIRRAEIKDIPRLVELQLQVYELHAAARPDIYQTDRQLQAESDLSDLLEILSDDYQPIFVAVNDENDKNEVLGYAMCQHQEIQETENFQAAKVLYVKDLCVDKAFRGKGIGSRLLEFCKNYARGEGYQRLELNVWEFPESALGFYENQGFKTQRRLLEFKL